MRDFQKELRDRFRKVDKPIVKVVTASSQLYNIHKRSLPPGIDKVLVIGVTKTEGEWWVNNVLKAKVYTDDSRNGKTLVYYDLIPQGASPRERSIYFNGDSAIQKED